MDTVECPYCNQEVEINHDDGAHYDLSRNHSAHCDKCDKYFMVRASCLWLYEGQKADCLNDGQHDFKIRISYPKEYSRMQCSMCDKSRTLTTDEIKIYG